jgi:hypothetical protein
MHHHLTGKSDLYAGLLLVHVKLAKWAGSAATFPPERDTVNRLFDACDIRSSGRINREEFDIFLSVSSAQIFGRILINWLTFIFVIPYYSKVSVIICKSLDELIIFQKKSNWISSFVTLL